MTGYLVVDVALIVTDERGPGDAPADDCCAEIKSVAAAKMETMAIRMSL